MADDPKAPEKPKSGASFLAGILKNAKAAPKHGVTKAGLETKVCSKCGAARAEGSDLTTCEYCGGSYLET
jgi:ribosomal protein L40E